MSVSPQPVVPVRASHPGVLICLVSIFLAALVTGLLLVCLPDRVAEYADGTPGKWRVVGTGLLSSLAAGALLVWWFHTPSTRKMMLTFILPVATFGLIVLSGQSLTNIRARVKVDLKVDGKLADKAGVMGEGKAEGEFDGQAPATDWPLACLGFIFFVFLLFFIALYLAAGRLDSP